MQFERGDLLARASGVGRVFVSLDNPADGRVVIGATLYNAAGEYAIYNIH